MSTVRTINDSILQAIDRDQWYPALALALTMPDICSYATTGRPVRGSDYIAWFDQWVGPMYIARIGAARTEEKFLTGNDAYALRCAYLHQGQSNIESQRARRVLEDFQFVVPPKGWQIHRIRRETTLLLDVSQFCRDICDGVSAWLASSDDNAEANSRANAVLSIEIMGDGPIFL